jgi:hypothetical protein
MNYFLICLLILFSACQENPDKKPEGLIEEDKMSLVLEEVLLLESHYQSKFGVPGIYKEALDKSLASVFKKRGVTKKNFADSYAYYASQPETFKALNTQIMDRLSRQVP